MSENKKQNYSLNKALVEHLWGKYQLKKDPRWLAEICLNVPFFGNPEVGVEIASILKKHAPLKDDIYDQTMRNEIWRLWKMWKGTDDDIVIRQRIGEIFFKENVGNGERVRGIIRAFEASEALEK